MNFEVLSTERLLLRKFTPADLNELFENYPKEEIKKQLGLTTDEEFERDKQKAKGGYTTYDRSVLLFKLILKETNEVIGSCGFHNWYSAHLKAELGYALYKEEHKRKGYMSEAVPAVLEYGFHVLHLNRVEACVGPANEASLRLVKKFGFTQEGYLRQHYIREGEVQDSVIFSLLKEEYEGRKK